MTENKPDVGQMWYDWFTTDAYKVEKQQFRFLRMLPHDPRCKFCNAPFKGIGGMIARTFYGKKRSSLNPRFCNICEHYAQIFPGGQEVEMAMLFVDIRGSTALSEQMNPTEFSGLINRFYVGTTHIITHEDGLVEKLAGDAVAAFWGSGIAGPNYMARTIHAAQNILKAMDKQKIPVGIGVHTGIAFFGAMGSADGLVNISAIGDEVNTAARLASKAAAGEIIISERALDKAGVKKDEMESRSLELKGIGEPVAVRVMHM
jgi:adenylate cyclase